MTIQVMEIFYLQSIIYFKLEKQKNIDLSKEKLENLHFGN